MLDFSSIDLQTKKSLVKSLSALVIYYYYFFFIFWLHELLSWKIF